MSSAKRLRALALVERVNRFELESIGAELSALRGEQARLVQQCEELSQRASDEAQQSTLDTRKFLPDYLASVDAQRRNWTQQGVSLEQAATEVELQLYASFRDLKVKELVRKGVEDAIALEDERAECALQDDGARALYRINNVSRSGAAP